MKKLFFIGCFVFLWSHSFPQRNELFQIWKTAAEDVNKYDYRPRIIFIRMICKKRFIRHTLV